MFFHFLSPFLFFSLVASWLMVTNQPFKELSLFRGGGDGLSLPVLGIDQLSIEVANYPIKSKIFPCFR